MRKVKEGSETYLVLYALRDIKIGEELRYDYGVKDLSWRKVKGKLDPVIWSYSAAQIYPTVHTGITVHVYMRLHVFCVQVYANNWQTSFSLTLAVH